MARIVNTDDFRAAAKRRLPGMVFDYLDGGSEGEAGLARNTDAFDRYVLRPKRLVDVTQRSLDTTLWDRSYRLPLYIAPTGLNGLMRPDGDAMLARAAGRAGIPFALSTASNMSIEDVADIAEGELWFQLYVLHRDIAATFCERARAAGYSTLILTVDVPVNGYRERDMRNQFGVPVKYTPGTIWQGATHPAWSLDLLRHGMPKLRNFETLEAVSAEAQAALLRREMDASFDWDALAWLRDLWPGRLMVKGLTQAADVAQCAELGVDAVILSNHGARQLDATIPPIDTVAEAVAAANVPVLMDSGIRRGADVIKALCLGASLVGLGRATLYALAARGEAGVDRCLEILTEEMDKAQALLGAPKIGDLGPDLIART